MRAWCRAVVAPYLHLQVRGLHHLPRAGPLLIACRHYHHFDDGCVLVVIKPESNCNVEFIEILAERLNVGTSCPRFLETAQRVVDTIVAAGITGIMSFAPIQLHVPAEVTLNTVNMAMELERLSFALSNRE